MNRIVSIALTAEKGWRLQAMTSGSPWCSTVSSARDCSMKICPKGIDMIHKPDDCPYKGVCEYNGLKPPYCNECVMPVIVVERIEGQPFPGYEEAWLIGKSLLLRCPRCRNAIVLRDEHVISMEGNVVTVSPSIGCPQCRYHGFLKAGEWQILSDY